MDHQTIATHFADDHDRLDSLFHQYRTLKRSDFPQAKRNFRDFKFSLQRHIIWEEEILFPLFEQKSGGTVDGPTEVMRREHRLIEQQLEAIHRKVKVQDPNSDGEDEALFAVLSAHTMKEEQILYPAIDRSIGAEEAARVFAAMDAVPPERYAVCCHAAHHPHTHS